MFVEEFSTSAMKVAESREGEREGRVRRSAKVDKAGARIKEGRE
jgi:hypothetical protein